MPDEEEVVQEVEDDAYFESGWSDRHGSHVDRPLFRDNERYRIGWLEADATLRMLTAEGDGH